MQVAVYAILYLGAMERGPLGTLLTHPTVPIIVRGAPSVAMHDPSHARAARSLSEQRDPPVAHANSPIRVLSFWFMLLVLMRSLQTTAVVLRGDDFTPTEPIS